MTAIGRANIVYGFVGSPIALPQISDQLAPNDPGRLTTKLLGLPAGAVVSDGKNTATIKDAGDALDLTGWNLISLTLTVPNGHEEGHRDDNRNNTLNLQVVATSAEQVNGS